ncbi:transcription antitermination factor NusB [Desulfoplanes sp. PS50]
MSLKSLPLSLLPPARRVALQTVYRCLFKNQDLQFALDQAIFSGDLSQRDTGLATELAYGYLRHKTRTDFLVASFLKSPEKLPPPLLLVLGLAGYELVCMDKIPAYATVDWAVEWTKKHLGRKLAGVGNAVLRRIGELGKSGLEPDFFQTDRPDTITFLARYYSCPQWIVKLWLERYGQEKTTGFLAASVCRPALGLRCASETDAEILERDFKDTLLGRNGHALALERTPGNLDALLREGRIIRQSYAAQIALHGLTPASWPTPVWDGCCGRGGKSLALFSQGIAPVWASDIHTTRLAGFLRECKRTGISIPIFRASAKDTPPFRTTPQTILLDVPCSGLGVLSRRPDSKWKRTPRDVAALVQTQWAILENAWNTLPTGGVLAYLTCTLNPAENQDQIAWLCREQGNGVVIREYETGRDEGFGEFFYGATIRKK